jgi:hypothetical protein
MLTPAFIMALSGFASGALVAAPMAAVLTWLAVTWQQHVDVRVERDNAVVRADRAAFNAGFASDWAAANGQPRAACDPEAAAELARLRKRASELEARLTGSSDDLERDHAELRRLMVEGKQ